MQASGQMPPEPRACPCGDAPGCFGPETYWCGEASRSDTADFPSPHLPCGFVFIAEAWSGHLWLKSTGPK